MSYFVGHPVAATPALNEHAPGWTGPVHFNLQSAEAFYIL